MANTYKIVRYHWESSNESRTIREGLSLQEAQEHCCSDSTQKKDNEGNVIWFDGYISE